MSSLLMRAVVQPERLTVVPAAMVRLALAVGTAQPSDAVHQLKNLGAVTRDATTKSRWSPCAHEEGASDGSV